MKIVCTSIYSVIFNGELSKLRFLVEVCHCSPLAVNREGFTALHTAAACGELNLLMYLVQYLLINAAIESLIATGMSPLHIAAFNGHLHVVKYLIESCQVDPLIEDRDQRSPLHYACKGGHLDIVKYLTLEPEYPQVNANDLLTSEGVTLLHCAAESGNTELITFLLTVKSGSVISLPVNVLSKDKVCLLSFKFVCDCISFFVASLLTILMPIQL